MTRKRKKYMDRFNCSGKTKRSFLTQCLGLLLVLMLSVFTAGAQDLFKAADLSTVKIDNLSDADIAKFQSQLQESGASMAQAERLALSKGMPQGEINKLKDRVSKLSVPTKNTQQVTVGPVAREAQKSDYKTFQNESSSNVFGAQLFNTPSLSFEPNLRIALPAGYILGPDDELLIAVTGYQEANIKVAVTAEGNITIPQVGTIAVAGITIEDATKRIRDRMTRTAYPNISSGLTQVTVTMGNIRSIHITVLGAVKPGNYTVSSLTQLFNSLYLSGGPGNIQSYRSIELVRNNKVFKKIDLYQLLMRGDQSGNVLLKDNDVINIPVYQKRVTVNGQVKRPGVYELTEGETLNDLLFFAGGFSEKAYTAAIKVKQITATDRRIKDLAKADFAAYQPGNGDEFNVEAVLDRMENGVKISGAVYRPGEFELTPGMTVGALIKKANGTTEDLFADRAVITRTRDDQTKESIAFNVNDVLKGIKDIPLRKYDEVVIASVKEFRDEYTVKIEGEVRKPGDYPFKENLTLKDLLFTAGNFTVAGSPYRIEIARRINSDSARSSIDSLAEVFDIATDRDLALKTDNFLMRPFDIVTVRKRPGYIIQKSVTISGEVLFPGRYTIQSKTERISDLLKRAGGLTNTAYAKGVYLVRDYKYSAYLQEDKVAKAAQVSRSISDTSNTTVADVSNVNTRIVVNMEQILEHPGSKEDYILEEGDLIDVSKLDPLVKISGEVFQSTKTSWEENLSFMEYLDKAGGVTSNARLSKAYVLYPNGNIERTKNALFGLFRRYPSVTTGAEIVVPKKMEHRKLTVGETVGITSAFISLISLLVVTISTLNR